MTYPCTGSWILHGVPYHGFWILHDLPHHGSWIIYGMFLYWILDPV